MSPSAGRSLAGSVRAYRLRVWLVAHIVSLAACTVAPEPPPTPDAVVQLSESYDRPTASLDQSTAHKLFDQSVPDYEELNALAGLTFLRGVIARAMRTPDIDEAADDLDVQGSLAVHAACPGWGSEQAPDEAETGYVDLIVGVDDSRLQRAFSGRATDCRFSAKLGGERAKVHASMQLEVDLGHSLGLGEPVPSILVRISELSAELSVKLSPDVSSGLLAALSQDLAPDGIKLELDAESRPLSMRVGANDLIETLVDLEPLHVGTRGTILLSLRDDGSVNVRGRDGAWDCSSDRSVPCVRSE